MRGASRDGGEAAVLWCDPDRDLDLKPDIVEQGLRRRNTSFLPARRASVPSADNEAASLRVNVLRWGL